MSMFVLLLLAVPLLPFSCSDAFTAATSRSWPSAQKRLPLVRRGGASDNDVSDGELISTLARWNRQWEIQQRASKSKSRWTKLILPKQEDKDADNVTEEKPGEDVSNRTPLVPQQDDIVYLLEPPFHQPTPSCLILFCGGAGLGQFPQIAYNELLLRISNKLNAAVLAVPYPVGLDHFKLAQTTGEHLRRAVLHCRRERNYSESIPIYCICHSLGCKLQTIYLAATQNVKEEENNGVDRIQYAGMGWISFNNFSFRETLSMASTFADQLRSSSRTAVVNPGTAFFQKGEEDVLKTIINLAETVVCAIGLDFSPNPVAMERLISLKFGAEFKRKTRLFVFDDDQMDNSREFLDSCSNAGEEPDRLPTVSGLPGGHLTPVYFKLSVDDLPEEARFMAREALGQWQSASFGVETELNALVQEVCDWVLGKAPSRPARWQQEKQAIEPPRIAGGVVDAD